MEVRIEILPETNLVGQHKTMTFSDHNPFELWRNFMPIKATISNAINTDLYSVEVYPEDFFQNYSPNHPFEKWAAVAVTDLGTVPESMETITIPSSLYAVFTHIGPQAAAVKTYNWIFSEWLPQSSYELDHRPHFAIMGEKYKKDQPDSEEEIWIPIRTL
ncbi:GyrI-like domain-containing protein [Flavobacterium agrisoli]|uniref:GyrI-like domain-containing protein n=1 Tax=Flavobacterium agrisoli TaxID=2793066 RepID=A0A934UJ59_9FLAO|nr:GyrI-like domain-containing protein [Flavobacterium agrisoli]MBK0369060.1 GyrI-like domain-containing protein [Flavobacterium agrisoli]